MASQQCGMDVGTDGGKLRKFATSKEVPVYSKVLQKPSTGVLKGVTKAKYRYTQRCYKSQVTVYSKVLQKPSNGILKGVTKAK